MKCRLDFIYKFNYILLGGGIMTHIKFTMLYWKGDKYWLGKILEHPEIMTQGETIEQLEANLRDAYLMMALEDVPRQYELKEIAV
jgi:predicted RNase H-like HicB family nuclease